MKCVSPCLGGTILDAISTIYHGDNANYFLLQNQHTLSQAAEKIAGKPRSVQEKFFQLIEFLVHHLQHIPTKELIAIRFFRILEITKDSIWKFQPSTEKQEEPGVLCARGSVAHFYPQVGQHLQRCFQRSR